MKYFDLAIVETLNGGDLVGSGQDLKVVYSTQNMPYLAWFGGNVEANTVNPPPLESFDWWGNNLLMRALSSQQFNSNTERALNTTTLNSPGRLLIESAMKTDLKFLADEGNTITIVTEITSTNRITVQLKILTPTGEERAATVIFKKAGSGDFWFMDFDNNDFFI